MGDRTAYATIALELAAFPLLVVSWLTDEWAAFFVVAVAILALLSVLIVREVQ